jgi:chromosome segregation ATPase
MDDIRDTRPWFWILFAIVFAVAVVGLVVALSASSSSVDEKKVVNDATAQIKEELAGLNGALKAADEFQAQSNKAARRDRARIKVAVASAIAGANQRLKKVSGRVAALESGQGELRTQNANLRKSVSNLNVGQEDLEAEVAEFDNEIRALRRNAGL